LGDMLSFDDFKNVDLRIARILDVREHPNADKLYLLRIDVGDEEKQIVAGIRAKYEKDELVGRKIVIVNNLEPVELRGERSEGMLLAAAGDEGPVILLPDEDVPAGARIG